MLVTGERRGIFWDMKKTLDALLQRQRRTAAARLTRKGISPCVLNSNSNGLSIQEMTSRYGISREALTRMTGFSLRAITNWSQGSRPSSSTTRHLTEIKRLFTALEKLVSPAAIGPWLREPNPAFDSSTPLQVIERGECDRVWRMIYELESGEPA